MGYLPITGNTWTVVFCRTLWFVLFRLSIVLYLLLRFMDSDDHFGIFKLFLNMPEILLLNEEGRINM
jgi:hypothetical protein